MKVKLNLTIDESLLLRIKRYAEAKHVSISELVEDYFKSITKSPAKKSVIDLVEKLEKPGISSKKDLKKAFYEDQSEKYGF